MFNLVKIANAQNGQVFSKVASNPAVNSIVTKIMQNIVMPLIVLLFTLATLIFIWGIFGMIRNGGDAGARRTGEQHVLWGVIGMLIMISAFGIIRLIGNTVGVGDPFM